MVSKRELVEYLVENGLSAVDAEKFVNEAFEKWREAKPNLEEYQIWDLVQTSVKLYARKLRRYGGVKFEVLVLGVDRPRDIYERFKRVAMRAYNEDPSQAILDGYVKVDDDGKVIPIDYRKELSDGRPNPNYGKPLPERIVRDAIVIANQISGDKAIQNRLAVLSGDLPEFIVGRRYVVTAKPTERNGTLYLNYAPLGTEEAGVDDPKELYKQLVKDLTDMDALVELKTVESCDGYETIVTKALVMDAVDTQRGTILTVEDIDNPTGGITVYCDTIVPVEPSSEVLITGRVIFRNDEPTISAFGVIVNPETIQEVKEVLMDLSNIE